MLIFLISIIVLGGCSAQSELNASNTKSGDDTVSVTSNDLQTIDQMIKNKYEISDFKNWLFSIYPDNPYQSYRPDISYIDSMFPTEYLQETDDSHCYAVYKTNQGFVYMFFGKSSGTDVMEYRCSSYVEKALSYSDFKNVKVGTPIGKVEKIDPAVATLKSEFANSKYAEDYWLDIRILTDGVLFTSYRKEANSSDYKVENINYFDDFIIDYSVISSDDYKINCKILEQDYPA